MVNNYKKISVRSEKISVPSGTGAITPAGVPAVFRGADLLLGPQQDVASPKELKFIRRIMRSIREALLGNKRKKNELARIIGESFGFDNTRVYVKGPENHNHLLGEHSRGEFRKSSSYENGGQGKNRIFTVLEEMATKGEFILRFDLRYSLFLWEDDLEVSALIKRLNLPRDKEQIDLMRRISPNKNDVLSDINYYLFHNQFHKLSENDITNIPLEMIFVALANGDKQVHGYIMVNNFITGTPLFLDEDILKETSEVILDTYKIYKQMEEEKDRAQAAERQLMERNMTLEEIAIKDGPTGLFSKRYFQEMLPHELERAQRAGTNVGLILMDIDHFKDVNDAPGHGHEVGDFVLAEAARIIKETLRSKDDIPCRVGGEEMAVLSSGVENITQLIGLARRIRSQINNHEFVIERPGKPTVKLKITISFGLSMGTTNAIYGNADEGVYYSKKHGRDKIVVKHEETSHLQSLWPPKPEDDEASIVFIK